MAASGVDGGYAWVVCAASFMVQINVGGFLYSTGIFYIMFQNGFEARDTTIALITSLNISFLYLMCPVAGLLSERFGERCIAMLGGVIATIGFALSSFTTEVYQLCFTYGIIAGIGMGMYFNTSISVLSKYFIKHSRTAFGLALCGLGAGSFIYPPLVTYLEDTYGWRGAILMIAGINAHSVALCALYQPLTEKLKQQISIFYISPIDVIGLQPKKIGLVKHVKQMMSLRKIIPFSCLSLHALILYFSVYIIYTHFGSYVLTLGYSKQDVVYLYMAMGIISTIARLLTGVLAEVTRVNTSAVLVASAILLGIFTIALPSMDKMSLMYFYAVIYQLLMTQYNILCPTIVADNVPRSQVPSGYGIVCFFSVPGSIFGPPLAAFVYDSTSVYANSFYMTGVLFVVAGLLMVPAACVVQKQAIGKTASTTSIISTTTVRIKKITKI